jgi:hypothetical protein
MTIAAPQAWLLDALLLAPRQAEDAWRRWRASTDLDQLDKASFHLLPALTGRMPAWIASDPERAVLMGICRRAWSQNQVQRKLLADAVQVLATAGIERVAATGPVAWASLYWPNGAIRPIGMVDLLVEPSMVSHAFGALSQAAWKAANGIPDTTRKDFPFAAGVLFQSPSSGSVRLHWRALPNTDFSLRRPEFSPLEAGRLGDVVPYTLPLEQSLVAALGAVHEDGIEWHFDALMICRQPGLRWNNVAALLRRRFAQRRRLDELRLDCGAEIPLDVTNPTWTNGVEQILASTLRAYRGRRTEAAE